jgi:hypothetical protein
VRDRIVKLSGDSTALLIGCLGGDEFLFVLKASRRFA